MQNPQACRVPKLTKHKEASGEQWCLLLLIPLLSLLSDASGPRIYIYGLLHQNMLGTSDVMAFNKGRIQPSSEDGMDDFFNTPFKHYEINKQANKFNLLLL